MRARWWMAVAGASALVFTATSVQADDVQSELETMKDMVRQLQDQMTHQQARIEEQDEVMQEAGLAVGADSRSGISSFLESTDFSGFAAASYTWNTRNSGNDGIVGQNNTLFHPDSNSFAVDQVWLTMDKSPTEESRGGFHVDFLMGSDASVLENGGNGGFGNDNFELFTAYVSYLAPIGDGIQIDAGEFGTLLGAEVVQANGNFNITRGLVWGLQPVTYTGVMASTEVAGVSVAAGFVNSPLSDTSADITNNKAFTGGLGYGWENYSASTSIIYGAADGASPDPKREGDKLGIWDVVLTADPTDDLSLWFNADWVFTDYAGVSNPDTYGLALAGRLAVTDATGVALRTEYIINENNPDNWAITATIDQALTDNLTAKLEGRYDDADKKGQYLGSNGQPVNDQWLLLAQMIYEF